MLSVYSMERAQNLSDLKSQEDQTRLLFDLTQDKKADSRLLEWAGLLSLENSQWPLAESAFSALLERRDKISDRLGLAKALRKQSRLDEAEELYLSAVEKITEPCSLLFIAQKALGEICLLKGDFSMAEERFNKAGTLNPSCPSLLFYRAMILLKEKNYKEAEKSWQIFAQAHLRSAQAWLGLALARKALGDEELALACLERSLDLDSKNARALKLKKQWKPSLAEELSNSLSFSA